MLFTDVDASISLTKNQKKNLKSKNKNKNNKNIRYNNHNVFNSTSNNSNNSNLNNSNNNKLLTSQAFPAKMIMKDQNNSDPAFQTRDKNNNPTNHPQYQASSGSNNPNNSGKSKKKVKVGGNKRRGSACMAMFACFGKPPLITPNNP